MHEQSDITKFDSNFKITNFSTNIIVHAILSQFIELTYFLFLIV